MLKYILIFLIYLKTHSLVLNINYFTLGVTANTSDIMSLLSYHSVNTNNMTTMLYTDTSNKNHLILFSYNYTQNYTSIITKITLPTVVNTNYQQRTAAFNTMNGTNTTFIFFSSTLLVKYNNNFTANASLAASSGQTFIQSFYITNSVQSYFLLAKNSGANYSLSYYTNVTQMSTVMTNISVSTVYVKSVQNNGYIFLQFQTGIYIYAQNSSFSFIAFLPFSVAASSSNTYGIDSKLNFLAYSINKAITVYDITNMSNFVVKCQLTMPSVVDDIQLIYSMLIINSNNTVSQFDIDLNITISTYNTLSSSIPATGMRIGCIGTSITYVMFFYYDFPGSMAFLFNFLLTLAYTPTGSTCYNGYYLSNSKCVKNISNFILNPVNSSTTNITNITNSTNNLTNNSTNNPSNISNTNITNNNSSVTNNSNIIINISNNTNFNYNSSIIITNLTYNNSVYYQDKYWQTSNQQQMNDILQKASKALTFFNFNLMPNMMQSLFLFLDDIWYYKFHRTNYPQTMSNFMNKVDILYFFRVNSWFLSQIEFINNIQIAEPKANIYKALITENDKNPNSIYFLNSASQIYISNWLQNIVFLSAVNFMCVAFFILTKFCKTFKRMYKLICHNAKWWTIFTMTIQGNLMFLTFICCLQFSMPSFLDITDKFNLFLCLLILLFTVIYCTVFYIFIYYYQRKKSAETILTYTKYGMKSFLLESYTFLLRTLCRGMIQGLTFQNYSMQITSLMVSDFVFCVITVFFRKQFNNAAIFLLFLCYNMLFFALDLFFVLLNKIPQFIRSYNYEKIVYIIILSIIAVYLLLFVILVVKGLYQIVRNILKYCQFSKSKQISLNQNQSNIFLKKKERIKYKKRNQTLKYFVNYQKKPNKSNINFLIPVYINAQELENGKQKQIKFKVKKLQKQFHKNL